ncbi:MAG: peptidoglycan DD-metalloendopeptidase family protein [Desulfovibrio sp.]|nr:peptidoglycan DD-metalloendopeptidase family protein [Desulfovibrio sp.]
MTTTPAAPLDASLAALGSLEQTDLLTRRRQVDQVRHEIAGGDEAAARRKDAKLREACQGFESIFLNKIWTQMRQSLPKEGYLHSKEEEFYQQMFDKELMDKMANNGGIGLGDMLYKHLKESSERASKNTSPSKPTEPLPLAAADRLRLAQQLREVRGAQAGVDAWPGTPTAATGEAQPWGEGDPGLAQVAYAPYGGLEDPATGSLDEAFDAQGVALQRPVLRPIPAPTIELQKPAPVLQAALDPNMPLDGREPTPLDLQAMQYGQAGQYGQGLSLGERLANAPLANASQANASQVGAGAPPHMAGPAAEPEGRGINGTSTAQSRAAEAYNRVGRNARTEGRRSNMPMLTDPVRGEITSGFGWRDDPFTGKQTWHSGVDIKAPAGTPVVACWDGTVVFAGNGGQYGNTVVLEHAGGWRSFYGHSKELTVSPGQTVKAGEQIATVGQSGRATGPHLHFEIRQGGLAWDPQQVKDHLLAGADKSTKS